MPRDPQPIVRTRPAGPPVKEEPSTFDDVYEKHFDFVWRSARRLGAFEASLDDVTQEIFVVVFRRLREFEGRASLRTWLFGITLHIVRNHLRTATRKYPHALRESKQADVEALLEREDKGPEAAAMVAEEVSVLYHLLDQLDQDKREVFVLVEIEEISIGEAAALLGLNANTAASRLRYARLEFNKAVSRYRARPQRPCPSAVRRETAL
jgi:RNA polymerase sigma-70 factor (ECF subfamily)